MSYGPAEPLGGTGLVLGRFLPLHRGHEYLIELARASVQKLTVLVLADEGDPISHRARVRWIAAQYPDVRVDHIVTPLGRLPTPAPDDAPAWARLARAIEPSGRHAYLFAAEPAYAGAARAIAATFVGVEPAVVPVQAAAIRADPMEHFRDLARPARPWFVRRVAVVGGERTGKTALCAWLRERFGCLVVPASTDPAMAPAGLQLAARNQLAAEDALATQVPSDGTAGILVCNTDLLALALWAERRFERPAPSWIHAEAERRPYDLYLVCGEDPRGTLPNAVQMTGRHDERCARAADAIIEVFARRGLCSARGQLMK